MPELSDFRLGADVVSSEGRKGGKIASVIVEAEGLELRARVVKEEDTFAGRLLASESAFITDEVAIPITAVESATHDVVRLSMSVSDIRRQAPYLSYRSKPLEAGTAALDNLDILTGGIALPRVEKDDNKEASQI